MIDRLKDCSFGGTVCRFGMSFYVEKELDVSLSLE
jgi:hypothetical protein